MKPTRTCTVKARLTPEEYRRFVERVKKSAKPDNQSQYIRECVFSDELLKSYAVAKELKSLNFQVRKIGVLVNQIAASANRGVWYPGDAELILKKFGEIENLVNDFQSRLKET